MENHFKQLSNMASLHIASSPAVALCRNFIANYDNFRDVDAARQVLLEEFRRSQCIGTNFCGFVSPLGFMKITAKDDAVCRCEFTDELCPVPPRGILAEAVLWLTEYFAGKRPAWRVETLVTGSPFAQEVWEVVNAIPFGSTISYGQIRDVIAGRHPGTKVSARAVGGAVGRNQLAIICPCHRVTGADGSLTGYAWGLELKKDLLEFEKGVICRGTVRL